jgi:HAD superfamily hydrolase (TIGR01450 family)
MPSVTMDRPIIYKNLQKVSESAEVLILDAYGVFYDSKGLYENSGELMRDMKSDGKLVYVLSNNIQLSEDAVANYEKKGLRKGEHYDEFFTSGSFTSGILKKSQLVFKKISNPKNVYIFGNPNRKIFEGTRYIVVDKIEDAHFVYISVPQLTEEQYKNYPHKEHLKESKSNFFGTGGRRWDSITVDPFMLQLENFKKRNLPILVANPDLVSEEFEKGSDESNFVIRQGSIAEAYRKIGGEVVEFGKPHREIYDLVFKDIEKRGRAVKKNKIFMVGDTIRTDIKGAKNAGIMSVLCTETGVTANEVKKRITNLQKNKDKLAVQAMKMEEIKKVILMDLQNENDCVADYLIEGISRDYTAKTTSSKNMK